MTFSSIFFIIVYLLGSKKSATKIRRNSLNTKIKNLNHASSKIPNNSPDIDLKITQTKNGVNSHKSKESIKNNQNKELNLKDKQIESLNHELVINNNTHFKEIELQNIHIKELKNELLILNQNKNTISEQEGLIKEKLSENDINIKKQIDNLKSELTIKQQQIEFLSNENDRLIPELHNLEVSNNQLFEKHNHSTSKNEELIKTIDELQNQDLNIPNE